MNLSFSWYVRALAVIVYAVLVAMVPASAALAHGGTGGDSSDYRISITGYLGNPSGMHLGIVELGNRVEVVRTEAAEVLVLGYEGEPYLRLDSDGVWENVNSPAHYLNADRFAATQPPSGVTAASEPSWIRISTGDSVRWHDHRTHWMSSIPPESVTAEPDVEQLVHADQVDMRIDGRTVAAMVEVTWMPKPEATLWLVATSVLATAVTLVLVLVVPARRFIPILAIAAAVGATLGQGSPSVSKPNRSPADRPTSTGPARNISSTIASATSRPCRSSALRSIALQ